MEVRTVLRGLFTRCSSFTILQVVKAQASNEEFANFLSLNHVHVGERQRLQVGR